MPFGLWPKHVCFQIVEGLGVDGEELMQRHAWESEFRRRGERGMGGVRGELMGNIC